MEEQQGRVENEEAVSELDALKLENESLQSGLKAKEAAITELEKALVEKDVEITALKQSLDDTGKVLEETRNALVDAVQAYKELIMQANSGLVAEMISGDTIEEIDESLKSAQALVTRVKQELGAESARVRVPAGAPQRTPLDLSVLSPREKIKYAMEGA